jgi:hypothetical protein
LSAKEAFPANRVWVTKENAPTLSSNRSGIKPYGEGGHCVKPGIALRAEWTAIPGEKLSGRPKTSRKQEGRNRAGPRKSAGKADFRGNCKSPEWDVFADGDAPHLSFPRGMESIRN